jgi:hypothetical protein
MAVIFVHFAFDSGESENFQPVAFGHIQTLVDAIDDWSPVMYWGHKIGGDMCHAGEFHTMLYIWLVDCRRYESAPTASIAAKVYLYVSREYIIHGMRNN